MPRGLKETSSTIAIGFSVPEGGIDTFTQGNVDLNLDPLNQEVFVVQSINLDPLAPDVNPGINSATSCSLTTTSQSGVSSLANANCLATARLDIRTDGALGAASAGVAFSRTSAESPSTLLEYLGIIATNDFFIQIQGQGNTAAKGVTGKLYGYRARADATIYSALVSSEVLSA
jgi:hypothetical protein